jgi:hypothetical protein
MAVQEDIRVQLGLEEFHEFKQRIFWRVEKRKSTYLTEQRLFQKVSYFIVPKSSP